MTHYLDGFVPDIECPECDGHGTRLIPGKLDDAGTCPDCHGHGWRPMTQDEIDDAAEAAWSELCEGEPPVTMREQHEAAWRQKQALR